MTEDMKRTLLNSLRKNDNPDEVKTFSHGKWELLRVNGMAVGRTTFEPGWRKSASELLSEFEDEPHFQLHLSGTMKIMMNNGVQFEFRAGDISRLHRCRDAWVEGNEPVVIVDFQD